MKRYDVYKSNRRHGDAWLGWIDAENDQEAIARAEAARAEKIAEGEQHHSPYDEYA